MYKLTQAQRKKQALIFKSVDLRLVIGFLKTTLRFIAEYPQGPLPFVLYGHRDSALQDELYAQGRTKPGPIVTNRPGGTSKHNKLPSEAIDVCFYDENGAAVWEEKDYVNFHTLWMEHTTDVGWGGFWKSPHDPGHYETNN